MHQTIRSFTTVLIILVCNSFLSHAVLAQSTGVQPTPVPGYNSLFFDEELNIYQFYHNGSLRFEYTAPPAISPAGGTFSMLRAYADNGTSFLPSVGGISAILGGVEKRPWDPGVSFVRLDHQIITDDTVLAYWAMIANGDTCRYTYRMKIVGRTLVIRIEADSVNPNSNKATAVELERCDGAISPAPIAVPYLSLFSILFANDIFTSFFADWEVTNASLLFPLDPVVEDSYAWYAHNIRYNSLTNGNRNRLQETLYLTTSPTIEDVFPNIPNPTSVYKEVSANHIVWDYRQPFARLIREPWRHLDSVWNVGVSNIWLQIHDWQHDQPSTPNYLSGYDDGLPCVLPANANEIQGAEYGGDPVLTSIIHKARFSYLYRIGLHQNYVDFYENAACAYGYSGTDVALKQDGTRIEPESFSSQVSAYTPSEPGEAHVVWEAYDLEVEEHHKVMYQYWHDEKWEEAHEFINASPSIHYYRPSVTHLSSGNVVWTWDDGSSTYQAENSTGEWVITEVYGDLIYSNLVGSGYPGPLTTTRVAVTDVAGPPYALVFGSETDRPENSLSSVLPLKYGRRAVVARQPRIQKISLRDRTTHAKLDPVTADTSGHFSVEVSAINLKLADGTLVPLEFTDALTPSANENSVWNRLATSPITLPANVDSVFVEGSTMMHGFANLVDGEVGLSFDVVDADNGTPIKRVNRERVYQSNGRANLALSERLAGLQGRRVILRPTIRGFAGNKRNLVSTVVHVHTVLGEPSRTQTLLTTEHQNSHMNLPDRFAVHPNYPNPFNPSTTIKYDLPENSNVTLVVYDVLGREVAQLVNGAREAGYHSAMWDASGVASGVYFARFVAMDGGGNVKLNNVRKLLLTK